MLDLPVQHLLIHVVNTPVKLQLLLMLYEQPSTHGTAYQFAQRLYRDIWSTEAALKELATQGVMHASNDDNAVYQYRPNPELLDVISGLHRSYNDPLTRDRIHQLVRQQADLAAYRSIGNAPFAFETI